MRKRYVIVLAVFLLAGATAAGAAYYTNEDEQQEAAPAAAAGVTETVVLEPTSGPTDDATLRNFAHDIWFGEIVSGPEPAELEGSEPGAPGIAMSVYEVRVVRSLKGDITGTVRVAQMGGVVNGVLEIAEGDALMEPARRYFLMTATDPERDWETVISPGNANIPVQDRAHERALEARFGGE